MNSKLQSFESSLIRLVGVEGAAVDHVEGRRLQTAEVPSVAVEPTLPPRTRGRARRRRDH